ncbi:uncharacterized protein PD653B2_2970 [Nocardioides sp. PD653-B2]|nr:uncharacterized protein PD653B2_2970 [Nocardioides sp. PD653-B2]
MAVVFVLLVVGGAAGAYFANGDEATALVACEGMVKDQLKVPSTADFSGEKSSQDGATWSVEGTVESENEQGVMVASDYVCVVRLKGEKWAGRADVRPR